MAAGDDDRRSPPGSAAAKTPPPAQTDRTAGLSPPQAADALPPGSSWRWSSAFRAVSGFAPNTIVAGRFRIVRFLGSGGMGEVYEAEDQELKERVALKTVRPEIAEDEGVLERFRREIQLARRVTHPSVCRSFDVFRHRIAPAPGWEGPTPEVTFLSMELLEGDTLADRIRGKGPFTTDEALPIVEQVASALAAAHDVGIVHRDFKSANVQLVPSKKAEKGVRAVVTDFGLARGGTTSAGRGASMTATGALAGTPAYMAPEQVEGGEITPATDVYALGVVMYEMVTGKWPFQGDTPLAMAIKRLNEKPPSPRTQVPTLDPKWEAAILRCLERDPADRFGSTLDVLKVLAGEQVAAGPKHRRRMQRRIALAAAAAAVLLGAALWSLRAPRPSAPETGARPPAAGVPSRRAIAVLGFKNLSGREDAAWLTKALAEMLTMELAAGEKLRIIPGENVARMKADLSLPETESLAPDTLAKIRTNLGTDLIVLGSYFAAGKDAGGKLRLDLRVQDAVTGETAATVTDNGTETELLELVSRAGAQLRQKLGAGKPAVAEKEGARASLPSTPEAARLYSEGLGKLRLSDALAARDLLEKAAAADPKYPLTHSALAEAWSALGYDAKAREEAKKAFDLSAGLGREERLSVEGRYREMAKEPDKAVEIYRTLWNFFPDSLDYGLRLAAAQTSAGKPKDALATIEALRKLPSPASEDLRIDLAEAAAAEPLSDYARQKAAAARAAGKGAAQGAQVLVAQARVLQCWASLQLGQASEALPACEEARRVFAAAGDRRGVSLALNRMAVIKQEAGDLAGAGSTFEETLAIARDVGSRSEVSRGLNNLGVVLLEQGQIGRARKMLEETLAIARERGDKVLETIAQQNLAQALAKQGDLAAALKTYEEVLPRLSEIGHRRITAYALAGLGEALRLKGDLARAREKEEESLRISREIGQRSYTARALHGLGLVLLDQGDVAGARKAHQEALSIREALGEKGRATLSRLVLAALSLEEGRPVDVEVPARDAAEAFQAQGRLDDALAAQLFLSRSLLAQGRLAEARSAVEAATALAGRSEDRWLRLQAAAAAARVDAAMTRPAQAVKALKTVLSEATTRGFLGLQLEVRLALGEIEMRFGDRTPGRLGLVALEQEARAKGFGLVARKAKDQVQ